jgi:transketolase
MTQNEQQELEQIALRVREHIIRMSTDGGCFIGASLSCTDLLVYLYRHILRITPGTTTDPNRDYLLLSKGHDVPALYGTLAELGFIEQGRLRNHLSTKDSIYWHPNRAIPGVEFHSGSLGHLLSVGIGIALDIRIRECRNRVFVLAGDGELDEGSMWEGIQVASALALNNLTLIVDRNGFQANVRTEELVPLEPLTEKFTAFGWSCTRIDGHAFGEMERACEQMLTGQRRPAVIIADTVRGKGLPSIENRADRWFVNFSHDEVEMLLRELHGGTVTTLTSETLIVR